MRSLSQRVAQAVVQVLVSGYALVDSESGHPVSLFGPREIDWIGGDRRSGRLYRHQRACDQRRPNDKGGGHTSFPRKRPRMIPTVSGPRTPRLSASTKNPISRCLKIHEKGLPTLKFMDSDRLRQGDFSSRHWRSDGPTEFSLLWSRKFGRSLGGRR
jgi:hypothetical protein